LQGKVAGVQVISGTSSTFESSAIRLRGEMDILYVVDGIKVSSTDINTDNIDNITILKGAAATALYGSEAKSGVIIITSKKAKAGESYISVDHNTTVSNISRLHPYQNEYGGGYSQAWDQFALQSQLQIQLHGQHLMDNIFLIMQLMNLGVQNWMEH